MKRIIPIAILLLTCLPGSVFPQSLKPTAELEFDTWFDNREYKSDLTPDMTLFGSKLVPELGLTWDGEHALKVGASVIIDYGDRDYRRNPDLILYYNYTGEKFRAYAGVFPRRKMYGDYPNAFVSDSVRYYDHNLDGLLLQYAGGRGYVELSCDWMGMMTETSRERFVLFSSGRIFTEDRKFFAGYYASMFHRSHSETELGVVDNILAYPYVGMRLGVLDGEDPYNALAVKVGWMQGMQRDRVNENKFVNPGGFQGEVRLELWGVGLYNTIYLGDNQMTYYGRYRNDVYLGDALYRTGNDVYDRLEIYWHAVRKGTVDLKISSVHHYDGRRWGWQQLLTLGIRLNKYTLAR